MYNSLIIFLAAFCGILTVAILLAFAYLVWLDNANASRYMEIQRQLEMQTTKEMEQQ